MNAAEEAQAGGDRREAPGLSSVNSAEHAAGLGDERLREAVMWVADQALAKSRHQGIETSVQ